MANKRLRDWPVIVRKYDIEPIGGVPQVVFDVARRMQNLWNELVALHVALLADIDGLPKDDAAPFYVKFNLACKATAREFPGLDTYQKWGVYERFDAALKRFYSGKADPPKPHFGLKRINIPFADRDGGKLISWLYRLQSRVNVRQVDSGAYAFDTRDHRRQRGSRGSFEVCKEDVPFLVNIHRPIPDDALLKRVNFCGELVRPFGWRWSIVFTLEVPELPKTQLTGRACAIDLGWRTMGDCLRIGTVTDSDGNQFEMRIPFNMSSCDDRAVAKFLLKRRERTGIGFDQLPEVSLQREEEIQSAWDLRFEQVKAAVKPRLAEIPEDLRPAKSAFHLVRNPRILKIYREMKKQVGSDPPEVFKILQEWAKESQVFHRRLTHCRESYLKARDWYYGNLAAWIAETYDIIAWEGDLDLKEMSEEQGEKAETESERQALKASQKYRKYASLSDLRLKIEHSAKKRGKELVKMRTAYSSSVCSICGSPIVTSKVHLQVKCKKGHIVDQDINTTQYFLQQLLPEYHRDHYSGSTPEVWKELEKIVVPLPRTLVATSTRKK